MIRPERAEDKFLTLKKKKILFKEVNFWKRVFAFRNFEFGKSEKKTLG